MSQYDLLSAWFGVAEWCAYDLAKDGYEGVVLQPLGAFPAAATVISRAAAQSENYMHRKMAACLAGWIREPEISLLDDLFRSEIARDARLPADDWGRLDTQSVVESIVFAATRWVREDKLQSAAFALLTDLVQRTINGEYWNTSSYAITTLVRYSASGAVELLTRFQSFANGPAPDHPSRPSLTQERQYAAKLLAGNPQTLAAMDVLEPKDLSLELDESSRAAIDQLCDVARQFERRGKLNG